MARLEQNAELLGHTCSRINDACVVEQRIGVLEGAHSALQSRYSEQLMALPAEERTQARDLLIMH